MRHLCFFLLALSRPSRASPRNGTSPDDEVATRLNAAYGRAGGERRPVGVCFKWQKGQCKHGDRCRFAHSNDPAAVAPPPPVGEFFVAPSDAPPVPENAADCVTPWRHIPYAEQLAKKRGGVLAALQKLPSQMRSAQRSAEPAQKPRCEGLGAKAKGAM